LENQSDALQEVGRTHSSDDGRADETENLHRWMQGATLLRENFAEQRGSSLDRVEVNSTITPIQSKEEYQNGKHSRNGNKTLSGDSK